MVEQSVVFAIRLISIDFESDTSELDWSEWLLGESVEGGILRSECESRSSVGNVRIAACQTLLLVSGVVDLVVVVIVVVPVVLEVVEVVVEVVEVVVVVVVVVLVVLVVVVVKVGKSVGLIGFNELWLVT